MGEEGESKSFPLAVAQQPARKYRDPGEQYASAMILKTPLALDIGPRRCCA
jgi:hypothetical protein